MNVYLLRTEDGRQVFYARDEEPRDAPAEGTGLRGMAERKLNHIKEIWQTSDRRIIAWTRRLWEGLQRRMHPDEALLIRLRTVSDVVIHHPASLSDEMARAAWGRYLSSRQFRHLPWLALNGLIAPLTVFLAPLPGPNLIGYWIAYRALRDLLILLGVRRARRGEIALRFAPISDLDRPIGRATPDHRTRAALGGDADGLADYLDRAGVMTGAGRAEAE